MVSIRLARGGSKKRPFYQITVTHSERALGGVFIERLGFFNPVARGQEERLRVDSERYQFWLAKGAQPSARVVKLLKDAKGSAAVATAA